MSAAALRAAGLRAAAGAAVVGWAVRRQLATRVSDQARWTRSNHRGVSVSLLGGPALAAGLACGSVLGGGLRAGTAGVVAVTGAAAFGLVDDLAEDDGQVRKGLRGHIGALAKGELTTGGLKVLGIGAASLLAGAIATGGRYPPGSLRRAFDVVSSGALIAGTANLVNLLDLRPGRALKAGALLAVAGLGRSGGPQAAACLGGAAVALGADLAERDMIGDSGANALGALVGTALVLGSSRPGRLALLAGVVGLTLASERVSFSEVIARHRLLHAIDGWGRRG